MTKNTIKTMSNATVDYIAKAIKCEATKTELTNQLKDNAEAMDKALVEFKAKAKAEAEARKTAKAEAEAEKQKKLQELTKKAEEEKQKQKDSNKDSKKNNNSTKDSKKETVDYGAIKKATIEAIKAELAKSKKLEVAVAKIRFEATANDDTKKHRFYIKADGTKTSVRIAYTKSTFNVVSNVDFTGATKTEQAHPYRATKMEQKAMIKAVVSAFTAKKQSKEAKDEK